MILIKISLVISIVVVIMIELLNNKLKKEYDCRPIKRTVFDKVKSLIQIFTPIVNIAFLVVIIFFTDVIIKGLLEKGTISKKTN